MFAAIMTSPLRATAPEPVLKVPVDAEKSKLLRPPVAVTLLPDATVVSPLRAVLPFKDTAPVPVLNVVAPVCVMFALVLTLVDETLNTFEPFTCSSTKFPVYPVAAFA